MKPLTRAQRIEQNKVIENAYQQGRRTGFDEGVKKATEDYRVKQNETHLRALDAIARIGSALGQSIDAINRSMQSDREQL